MRILIKANFWVFFFFSGLWGTAAAAASASDESLHDKGVTLAREGNHQEGLAILQSILDKNPEHYSVRRDLIIISTWAGDCDRALSNYRKIQDAPEQETYLLLPVSDCLEDQNRREEAIALLEKHAARSPQDEELQQKLAQFKKAQAFDTAPAVSVSLSSNNSDQGNLEWLFETRYSQQLLTDTRGYARFLAARADDPEFTTGDLNRLGAGVIHHFNYQWTLDAEVSTDIKEGGEAGLTGTLTYEPHTLWLLGVQHATFAEDLPLRAKAVDVTSDRSGAFVDYHTANYLWTGNAGASRYDFSDSNERVSFYAAGSYAYYLQPKLEHRLILDWYTSTNSLPADQAVYYNPSRDSALTLTHKSSLVYDSRFTRHVDHLLVFIGNYDQENYESAPIYGVGLQQEYNFTDYDYFTWGAGLQSRVYDGNREQQGNVYISYEHKF